MTVKLELSDEAQARLEAQAVREGVSVETYLQHLIERLSMLTRSSAADSASFLASGNDLDAGESELDRLGRAGEASAGAVLDAEDFADWALNGG